MTVEENLALDLKYWKILKKKLKGTPEIMQILPKRTHNTAVGIIELIHDIPFEKLSMSLYFYCLDVKMNQLTRLYESQIELAGANPDRFIRGLHKFYNEVAYNIKKEDLYDDFFELLYRCSRLRLENQKKDIDDDVMVAYLNLILQHTEYMRPSKFDFNTTLVGRKTTGELIVMPEPYYNIDFPNYDIRDNFYMKDDAPTISDVKQIYKRYGYDIDTPLDIDILMNKSKIFTSSSGSLLPFINEFTYDILPVEPFEPNVKIFFDLIAEKSTDEIKDALLHRKATLATNGVKIIFNDNSVFKGLLMKETYFDNTVFMLYRITTVNGDLSGFYDTKKQVIFNPLYTYKEDSSIEERVSSLILFCYACYTLKSKDYSLKRLSNYFYNIPYRPIKAEGYLQGGKLANVYDKESSQLSGHFKRKDNDAYESEERRIQPFIKTLPKGQHASKEALELAESYGYDLDEDQTFVRPFTKQVFKLKIREQNN